MLRRGGHGQLSTTLLLLLLLLLLYHKSLLDEPNSQSEKMVFERDLFYFRGFLIVLQGYVFVGVNIVLPFTTWIQRQQPTWRLGAGTCSLTMTTTTTTKPQDQKKYLIQDEATTTTTAAHTTTTTTTTTTSSQEKLPPAKEEEWEAAKNHFTDFTRIDPTRNNQHVRDATRGSGHSTATTTSHSSSSLRLSPCSFLFGGDE